MKETAPESSAPVPAILMEDLSFSYGGARVLENVNATIDADDFACVVGPNGGGKTTLIKLALGLLRPESGRVLLFGRPPNETRSKVGYVPQYFQFDMYFPIKVLDVVLMGRLDRHRAFGHYGRTDADAARSALAQVDLAGSADRPFAALSGGQRQRVLIARALAAQPQLLILDEPMANIDPAVQNELYEVLKALHGRLAIVMVTHDMGFVSTLVNRVVCVNRTVRIHPTSELTGDFICDLYGSEVSMVRHDHRCSEEGHQWPNS